MNKHTILIVDDEPGILASLKRVLAGDDKDIFVAKDAEEAWNLLKEKGEVEVIISDNKLPKTLGIEFFVKVKRLYPDTIRILITGYPDLNSAMDAVNKAHIWRFLLKPIEIDELKILVSQAFDYYRIIKENRILLQIARQHAQWINILKNKYPEIIAKEVEKNMDYAIDEKRVAEIVEEFMKRYYPEMKSKEKNEQS